MPRALIRELSVVGGIPRSLAAPFSPKIAPLTEEQKRVLANHDWPGNVRELQNVIELAVITSNGGRIESGPGSA